MKSFFGNVVFVEEYTLTNQKKTLPGIGKNDLRYTCFFVSAFSTIILLTSCLIPKSCSKTLREIVKAIGIHNNMDVIRDFLVQIYRTQEMYAKRGNRKPDHPSPPKWEYLITVKIIRYD